MCHCEGASRPWQSREGSYDFAGSTLLSGCVPRDCHVASLLAMTRQGGAAVETVHCIEFAVVLPLRGRERHAAPLQTPLVHIVLTAASTNRSCSAGRGMPRPYKGSCRFNGGRYESFVRRRARLSPPLQHPAVCRIFFIVPYSPGKIHPVGKKRSLSVKSMEKRLKTGPFCDTINLYQNECTARRRGLHLHTDTTIIGGKHHECSRDHGTAQRIFL